MPKFPCGIDDTDEVTDHELPQDLDYEKIILGTILYREEAYDRVEEWLKPETFYDYSHQ